MKDLEAQYSRWTTIEARWPKTTNISSQISPTPHKQSHVHSNPKSVHTQAPRITKKSYQESQNSIQDYLMIFFKLLSLFRDLSSSSVTLRNNTIKLPVNLTLSALSTPLTCPSTQIRSLWVLILLVVCVIHWLWRIGLILLIILGLILPLLLLSEEGILWSILTHRKPCLYSLAWSLTSKSLLKSNTFQK